MASRLCSGVRDLGLGSRHSLLADDEPHVGGLLRLASSGGDRHGVCGSAIRRGDFIKRRHTRNRGFAWTHAIVRVLVLLLVFINSLIHASDGWTAVMPWGLTLSALTVLLVVLAGLLGEFHIRASGDRRYA